MTDSDLLRFIIEPKTARQIKAHFSMTHERVYESLVHLYCEGRATIHRLKTDAPNRQATWVKL